MESWDPLQGLTFGTRCIGATEMTSNHVRRAIHGKRRMDSETAGGEAVVDDAAKLSLVCYYDVSLIGGGRSVKSLLIHPITDFW